MFKQIFRNFIITQKNFALRAESILCCLFSKLEGMRNKIHFCKTKDAKNAISDLFCTLTHKYFHIICIYTSLGCKKRPCLVVGDFFLECVFDEIEAYTSNFEAFSRIYFFSFVAKK